MAIHNEIQFENDICDHLAANGWLYSPDDTGYDKGLTLYPEDAIGWICDTQPDAWDRMQTHHGAAAEAKFLSRLITVLESEGTLHVLPLALRVVAQAQGAACR